LLNEKKKETIQVKLKYKNEVISNVMKLILGVHV